MTSLRKWMMKNHFLILKESGSMTLPGYSNILNLSENAKQFSFRFSYADRIRFIFLANLIRIGIKSGKKPFQNN